MNRPGWDEYFLGIAEAVAARASCPRARIGAVLVDSFHHIVGTGYNGAPPGFSHCIDVGCQVVRGHCQRAVHADMNAIIHTPNELPGGCTLYLYGGSPCFNCALRLVGEGIQRVVYRGNYGGGGGINLLREQGVSVLEIAPTP